MTTTTTRRRTRGEAGKLSDAAIAKGILGLDAVRTKLFNALLKSRQPAEDITRRAMLEDCLLYARDVADPEAELRELIGGEE